MKKNNIKQAVSVIIPTRNRHKEVIECLRSISIQSRIPEEIIIVDSSDNQNLKNKIKQFRNLSIYYIHTEPGLELQRNMGIRESNGDIIVFSDDDTIWDKDYLKEIERVFNKFPENIGGVTGNPIQKKTSLKKFLTKIGHIILKIFLLTTIDNGKFKLSGRPSILPVDMKEITPCEFLFGFSMAFKRDVITQFWFDENLKGYVWNEDDDIAYRVSRKYQNYFTPFAKILHNRTPSSRDNEYISKKKKIEYHYYLFKKNLPQDFKHKIAYWWSVIGIFVEEILTGIIKRNLKGVFGASAGLKNILKGIQLS
jgi:glycosyltransferase involved in cell wall biosynthesis